MFYLVKVLIGRMVVVLDRSFSYYTLDETIEAGERVLVSFGNSKSTIGFVLEAPTKIDSTVEEYEKQENIKLAPIQKKVDTYPLLSNPLLELANKMASYYKCDLIKILSSFLPPSMKPRDSALKKPQGKTVDFVFSLPIPSDAVLSKNEKNLYLELEKHEDGIRETHVSAKASLQKLIEKKCTEIREIPISRIPEIEAKSLPPIDLTNEQKKVYDAVLEKENQVFLLEGVTGSGKTEVYLKLCETYLKQGKGVLVLVPEIALTDRMADKFASYFKDAISILNSSLSDARKYDEYQRIAKGETKIVLGTRSAIFSPIHDLALIIIDEEHSSSYKQDNVPYYDAIKVACLRSELEKVNVLLASATPRVIDKARAERNIYQPLFMKTRYSIHQEHETVMVNMENIQNVDLKISTLYSKTLIQEIQNTISKHEQAMILLNRRGYSPIYSCQECNHVYRCPNCAIPLNYHKKSGLLKCHHCGFQIPSSGLECECGSHDFIQVGYGTERAYEELRFLFPNAKIYRLDSDVSNNDVRHEILDAFSIGEADILVGTQVIAKGLDFPNVTLAAVLDADFSLRLPTYLANEETFDLISQFVGRAGRANKKGKILIQTYSPDNEVIQLAAKQDYDSFYQKEMEERRKFQYPPYVYLTNIVIKGLEKERVNEVAASVRKYLGESCLNKRVNIYGPSLPYIPYTNGRHYKQILLKYKSLDEISPILDGIKTIRLANKDVDILINVDPGREGL